MINKVTKQKQYFLDDTKEDLFLFTGHQLHNTPFESHHGTRTFIGHFEEYVRWERAKDSEVLREKYVITNSHPTQSIYTLNASFKEEVKRFKPSVVSYLIDPENDFINTPEQFVGNLLEVIRQVLQLTNGQAKFVLLTPCKTKDKKVNEQISTYIKASKQALTSELNEAEFERIFVVDAFIDENISGYANDFGQLNEIGHLKLSEKLATTLYRRVRNFPGEKVKLDLTLKQEKLVDTNDLEAMDERLKQRLEGEEPLTWLFMGDSITHGALWTFGYKDYVELIDQYARETFNRKEDIFINTAVSGATILSTLNRIEHRLEAYEPDIISVKLGANDVVSFTPAEYKENLETLLQHLYKKNALIVLATPTPSNIGGVENERMKEYLSVLEEVVSNHPDVLFVNHYSELQAFLDARPEGWKKKYTIYTDERLHLGANGQLYMFHNYLKHLHLIKEASELLNYYYVSKEEDALVVKDVFNTLYK